MASFKRWLVGTPLTPAEIARLRAELAQQAGQGGPTRRAAMTGGAAIVGSMAGRGGQQPAPMNAPPGGPMLPGVQPGTSPGTVFARYVIIFGTNDGWFVYQSGTIPGPGNTPIAWGAAGTTDPFGNVLPFASTLGIASTATFSAGDTLITPNGIFTYSASPAAGLLIASVTPAAGTDPFTDVTPKGINSYVTVSGVRYATGLNQTITSTLGSLPGVSVQDTASAPNSVPGLFAAGSSGATKLARAGITSGKATAPDVAALAYARSQVDSGITNGTWQISAGQTFIGDSATIEVDDNNGTLVMGNTRVSAPPAPVGWGLYADANNDPALILPSGRTGTVPVTSAVQGGNTVTATGFNAAFTPFSIPANDAQQNTSYRITCGGHGTQATGTAVALNFRLQAFALSWGSSTDTGGIVAGDSFHWHFTGTLIVGAPGISAAASFFGLMTLSQATASAQGHPTAMDTQVASGVDTTSSTNITLQVGWASTTGSPSIVCTGATFERIGA